MEQLKQDAAFYFPDGLDSYNSPELVSATQYVASMNTVCRGGIIQTRPGYKTIFGMPCGNPQGFTIFTPTDGNPNMVVAIDGSIYISEFPFKQYRRLDGLDFWANSRFVYFQDTVQTTEFNNIGQLQVLSKPRNVLIIQDGFGKAGFWDGTNSGRLTSEQTDESLIYYQSKGDIWETVGVTTVPNPDDVPFRDPLPTLPSDQYPEGAYVRRFERITSAGKDETPQGTWMAWAGNRLWVARGNQVFASDYGNPLKFTESTYINEGRSFYLPEECTGMIQPSDNGPLYVFTDNTNTALRADILDRTQWLSTPDFQKTDYNIGCAAGKSFVKSYGQLWWYSQSGWTNRNIALNLLNDSRFRYLDNQMNFSKGNLSPDLRGICAAPFENYVLVSVPNGSLYNNRHTWCFDQSTTSGGSSAWNSVWTGVRPVEWAKTSINGRERIYCLSHDEDGVNRIWEAFHPDREDNGCPITCWVQFREHNFNSKDKKTYRWSEYFLQEILGTVDIAAYYKSEFGGWIQNLTKRIVASEGEFGLDPTQEWGDGDIIEGFSPQSRDVKTQEADRNLTDCNKCPSEDDSPSWLGTKFSNLLVWSGRMGVMGYRMWIQEGQFNKDSGECELDEEGVRILTQSGCTGDDPENLGFPFGSFSSTQSSEICCPTGFSGSCSTGVAMSTSTISQLDADKKAECESILDAQNSLECSK